MEDWLSVVLLLGMGIVLLLIELLFVPGTTFVGLIGLILSAVGVVMAYQYFGTTTGTFVLVGSSGLLVGTAVYSLRSGVWDRFASKDKLEGKVNDEPLTLVVGDTGQTTSALRPIGKAEFGNQTFEVRTFGEYVESEIKVKITAINHTKIFVEPLTDK